MCAAFNESMSVDGDNENIKNVREIDETGSTRYPYGPKRLDEYDNWSASFAKTISTMIITSSIEDLLKRFGPECINVIHPSLGYNLLHCTIDLDLKNIFWQLIEGYRANPLIRTRDGKSVIEMLCEQGKLHWLDRFHLPSHVKLITRLLAEPNDKGQSIREILASMKNDKNNTSVGYMCMMTISMNELIRKNEEWLNYLFAKVVEFAESECRCHIINRKRLGTFDTNSSYFFNYSPEEKKLKF